MARPQRRPNGPGEDGDAVGDPAGLGGGVVQLHEVAEDVGSGAAVAVALLHLAQVGEHGGGQRLDPARGGGAGGHGGGAAAFGGGDLLGDGAQDGGVGRVVHGGHPVQDGVRGVTRAQLFDQAGQVFLGEGLGGGPGPLGPDPVFGEQAVPASEEEGRDQDQQEGDASGDQDRRQPVGIGGPERPAPDRKERNQKEQPS